MTTYRIAAINDECDCCSRCGKTGLKRVVWLYELEDGPASAAPVGLDCAAILLGYGTRKHGKVAPEAIRRVVLQSLIQDYTAWLARPIHVRLSTRPGKFLRLGMTDLMVEASDVRTLSPLEDGQDLALTRAAWDLARTKIQELSARWYAATGLKTSFTHEDLWAQSCRNRLPQLVFLETSA